MWGLRQSGCAVQTASSCGCGLQRQQQPQALRRQQRLSLRVFLRMPAGVVSGHWPAELRFRVQGLAELTPLLSWLYGFALPAHPLLLLLLRRMVVVLTRGSSGPLSCRVTVRCCSTCLPRLWRHQAGTSRHLAQAGQTTAGVIFRRRA